MAKEKENNNEETHECCNDKSSYWMKRHHGKGGGDAVYGLGLIGSLVYFLSHATTFWMVILGILKSLVWPAFLVYHLFTFLHL